MATTILVTGGVGQVGRELQELASSYSDWKFIFTDVAELDITKKVEIDTLFGQYEFDYCINCAAYTAVDKAESQAELAHLVNVTGVELLAKACANHDTTLIHLSTDYVYHNENKNTPFVETDATNPQSVYAKTKLEGEQLAQAANPQTMIIRTSWVYSAFESNFVKTMLRLGEERDHLNIVFDQIGTPTYAENLADAILQCIKQKETGVCPPDALKGIYHYSNEGVCSWYDFAIAIFDLADAGCDVYPIETKDYPTPAKRPHFSLLNKNKFKTVFKLNIPHWSDSLARCIYFLLFNER